MSKKQSDLVLGFHSENEMLMVLQNYFGDSTMNKTRDPFGAIDFIGDEIYCELKTRRIKHDQYDTCLIGCNKLEAFKRSSKKNYIVYRYLDGNYYIEYDQDLFRTFETNIHDTWRDGRCEKSKVTYIPIIHLKKME